MQDMKVWVVLQENPNYYKAYDVVGVFLDYDRAVAFAETIEYSEVEEHTLDTVVPCKE